VVAMSGENWIFFNGIETRYKKTHPIDLRYFMGSGIVERYVTVQPSKQSERPLGKFLDVKANDAWIMRRAASRFSYQDVV